MLVRSNLNKTNSIVQRYSNIFPAKMLTTYFPIKPIVSRQKISSAARLLSKKGNPQSILQKEIIEPLN